MIWLTPSSVTPTKVGPPVIIGVELIVPKEKGYSKKAVDNCGLAQSTCQLNTCAEISAHIIDR